MGNIALPALSVRPMEDPLDQYAKMAQIKALMQGQQLSAAELQSRNLQNQQLQMSLQGQQRVMEAMKDPAWNPTDIDSAYRLLQKHSVPVANQENVIKFISTTNSSPSNRLRMKRNSPPIRTRLARPRATRQTCQTPTQDKTF